jgi:hypothetical protein
MKKDNHLIFKIVFLSLVGLNRYLTKGSNQQQKQASANTDLRQTRINRQWTQISRMVFIIVLIGCSGLSLIFFLALRHRRTFEGKLLNAQLYSPTQKKCYPVEAKFDKSQVNIYFPNENFALWENLTIPQGGFITLIMDDKNVNNPQNIRLLDPAHNIYLELNIVDRICPSSP